MRPLSRRFFLITILSLSIFSLKATMQEGDIVIFNNDTLRSLTYPLNSYPNFKAIKDSIQNKYNWGCTANWTGYQCVWKIEDDKLFLIEIKAPCGGKERVDLKELFGKEFQNNRVYADWFTGTLVTGKGETLTHLLDKRFVTEEDIVINILSGEFIDSESFTNFVYISDLYKDNDALREYIYSNIQWDKLPLNETDSLRIVAKFSSSNLDKKVDSVKIIRGGAEIYEQELIRVLKSLPSWNVFFVQNKFIPFAHIIPVVFSYSNKKKYEGKQNLEK